MNPLTAARAQMEVSLGFHMVFAATGIGLPLLLLIAEGLWLATGRAHYREIARRWSKALAVLFAVGAVSGTALSFELGLLWPRFMARAGPIVGPAFALEAYAFFLEAIFIGLYLYGWDRLSPRAHWATGIVVAVSGLVSGAIVVAANAWMQSPAGHEPWAPFRSPAWPPMALHSSLACYASTGFAAAGVYALALLRGKRDDYHRSALAISLAVGAVASILQLPAGHVSAQSAGRLQPGKLAAAEAHFETRARAPIIVLGLPDSEARTTRFGIELPALLSILVANDPEAVVKGLDSLPRDQWPNVAVAHAAFDVMVGSGMALIAVSALWAFAVVRKREPGKILLRAIVAASPLGFLALEAGWAVTEVGRQPWTIYGELRTSEAVTPASGVSLAFFVFTILYVGLAAATVSILFKLAARPREAPAPVRAST